MSNPLYDQMSKEQPSMLQQFAQFKQNFRGNPQQIIQQMMQSGKISQEQFDKAVQTANRLMGRF